MEIIFYIMLSRSIFVYYYWNNFCFRF